MFQIKKIFGAKDGVLGIAKETRRYDLPLNKGSGSTFLRLLIGMMTFLALLAIAASFVLGAMTERWSSGLENKATIEIPAEDAMGNILSPKALDDLVTDVYSYMSAHPTVESVELMAREDIIDLVSPWLGNDLEFSTIPLPGILSVSFKPDIAFDMEAVTGKLYDIAPQAKLDTHESWLKDVLKFTGALNFAAILITIVIGVTTVVAVIGVVQARMAAYHEELELLHLMGASDSYISRQLQRYVFILALQGAVLGTLAGAVVLIISSWGSGKMDISLLPDFALSGGQILSLGLLPIIIAVMGMYAARHTVLRHLREMP